MKMSKPDALAAGIVEIEKADRVECLRYWRKVFGRSAPKYLSPRFMKRVLIWETQNQALGGVLAKTDRALKRIASGKQPPINAKPGSHLIREWNGRTYQVEVTGEGYVMEGKTYRSLTAIALRITGTRWSGPRFFGLI